MRKAEHGVDKVSIFKNRQSSESRSANISLSPVPGRPAEERTIFLVAAPPLSLIGHDTVCASGAVLALQIVILVAPTVRATDDGGDVNRQTLDAAIRLAGPGVAALPIVLASVPPDPASKGVEAWTAYGEDGRGTRIFAYSRSGLFQCASAFSGKPFDCPLMLTSVLVHEAWHFQQHSESESLGAQI